MTTEGPGKLLANRVAIVTGAGGGIGRCHALELAAHGAAVVVNDLGVSLDGRSSESSARAQSVVDEIVSAGGTAHADGSSVASWTDMEQLVASTVAQYGHLDIVVNNAGIVRDRMITSMVESDWSEVITVHLTGTFNMTAHACNYWRTVAKSGGTPAGRIINTTSGTGLFGNIGQAAYGAAKAGIANLTIITAMEMNRYGVTANAVSPIAMTRMLETMPSMASRTVSGDTWDELDPGNSSPVVAWLASEESGWLSGAVLRISGNTVYRMQGWATDTHSDSYSSVGGERLSAEELDLGLRRAYRLLPSGIPMPSSSK
jgi:NAD(P)-dependent dehydrogenase (short-subunit alcohol dehydrogenase family)